MISLSLNISQILSCYLPLISDIYIFSIDQNTFFIIYFISKLHLIKKIHSKKEVKLKKFDSSLKKFRFFY